jgi:exodeoxyribonuclease VII large subunit
MEKVGIAVNEKSYSLVEVMRSIQSVLQRTYAGRTYWVRCELARISLHVQSGHCYLELVEKNETAIIAQLKGTIWNDKYEYIYEKFRSVTQTPLVAGMKVLFQCQVSFHPVHGLSFNITDVEPSFTLGEMARMKNESVARLRAEGLFEKNKTRPMPLLPRRIAVISVETSRGYHDFVSTLAGHPINYAIHYRLFEAILQGEKAVPSLVRALKNIEAAREGFDAVAIIRGGAGDAGLACYDEYELASAVARCSLPVITGIGHATNETVTEMIVYKNCITPTAAATFLLDKFDLQNQNIIDSMHSLIRSTGNLLHVERQELSAFSGRFCLIAQNRTERLGHILKSMHAAMPAGVARFLGVSRRNLSTAGNTLQHVMRLSGQGETKNELERTTATLVRLTAERMEQTGVELKTLSLHLTEAGEILKNISAHLLHAEEKVKLLDPVNTLRRGFSITRLGGKALTRADKAIAGDKIITELADGTLTSIVEKKN